MLVEGRGERDQSRMTPGMVIKVFLFKIAQAEIKFKF